MYLPLSSRAVDWFINATVAVTETVELIELPDPLIDVPLADNVAFGDAASKVNKQQKIYDYLRSH